MDRKNVLEIEYKQINEEWFCCIVALLDTCICSINDDGIGMSTKSTDTLFINNKLFIRPEKPEPFLIKKEKRDKLELIVSRINEKYGKKKKTPEEIFAQYTPVPFIENGDNFTIYYCHSEEKYFWSNDDDDFSVSGTRYYSKEDIEKIEKELNENCR